MLTGTLGIVLRGFGRSKLVFGFDDHSNSTFLRNGSGLVLSEAMEGEFGFLAALGTWHKFSNSPLPSILRFQPPTEPLSPLARPLLLTHTSEWLFRLDLRPKLRRPSTQGRSCHTRPSNGS